MKNQTSSQLPVYLKPVYDILKSLVVQIELLPGSNLTSVQLDKLEQALVLAE